jgi:sortase A
VLNKVKLSSIKLSLITALSLGLLLLGIGVFTWSIINIQLESDYSSSALKLGSSQAQSIPDEVLYNINPEDGENIGRLTIPTLKLEFPIIQGTGEKELEEGVGHFNQSVLPGEDDNCVLSGHRETAFRQLGMLKIGDPLIVQTSAGTFTYKVIGTRIVAEDDKTVIVPTDHAVLTLTTCYPFDFVGSAPDRYIVSADLMLSNK